MCEYLNVSELIGSTSGIRVNRQSLLKFFSRSGKSKSQVRALFGLDMVVEVVSGLEYKWYMDVEVE